LNNDKLASLGVGKKNINSMKTTRLTGGSDLSITCLLAEEGTNKFSITKML